MQIVKTREVKNLNLFTREKMYAYQPPPKALRFSHGRRRARNEWLVMNRRGPWEGYTRQAKRPSRKLSPSRLPLRAHFYKERRLGTRQYAYDNRPS